MGRLAAQFKDNAEPKQIFTRPECRYIVIESQPHKNIGTKKMAPHKKTVNLQEEIVLRKNSRQSRIFANNWQKQVHGLSFRQLVH